MAEHLKKYPNTYELKQSLGSFCKASFVQAFPQRKGIFITNANQEERADFLSGLFYENSELEEIRSEALGTYSKTTLSGFWIQSEDQTYNLVTELEKQSNEIIDQHKNMFLGKITGNSNKGYKGTIKYEQTQPGRLEFLQGTPRDFDFYIQDKHDGKWEIIIDGTRSNDAKIMKDWMHGKLPREVNFTTVDQDELNTQQTVNFFDLLAKKAVSNDWKFNQVKRIVVRKENQNEDDETDQDVNKTTVLTGISQAILEGSDLRNNTFVKQCESSGYRFTAMTYQYEHKKHPYVMEVRAEFKLRPKLFEVSLENYHSRSGIDGKLYESTMPATEKMTSLSGFYTAAKILFDDLVLSTRTPLKSKK
ncbi:MAG: hypothetical protein JNK81_06935 [Anaerolineales bacterium]|nr:hypothetical protein [Anaerolineales bacterium]